jgi:predicted ribosome-associated RNA-binding protein Tma20
MVVVVDNGQIEAWARGALVLMPGGKELCTNLNEIFSMANSRRLFQVH